jgi:hypothetical protein
MTSRLTALALWVCLLACDLVSLVRDHHSVLNHGWNCNLFMFQAGTVGSLGLICNGCGCIGWWRGMWLVLQVKIRASMHAMAQVRVDCIPSQFMGDDGVNAERSAFLGTYRGNTCISALPSQCVFPNCRAVQLLHKHNMLTASSRASSVFKPNNTHTKSACSYKSHIPLASQRELYQESLSSGMAVIERSILHNSYCLILCRLTRNWDCSVTHHHATSRQ